MKNILSEQRQKIILVTHSVFHADGTENHGTAFNVSDFLDAHGIDYIFLRHAFYGDYEPKVKKKFNSKKTINGGAPRKILPLPFRFFSEGLKILKTAKENKCEIFIGVDPINAVWGILSKMLGFAEKIIFYSVDYSEKRFSSRIFSWIYRRLDRFAALKADEVWNVSTRIFELREKQGVTSAKNFLVPNALFFDKIKRVEPSEAKPQNLVIITDLSSWTFDFDLIFFAIKKLLAKYPEIKLAIIGFGKYEAELKKIARVLGLERQVEFLGKKNRNEVINLLPHYGLGLALYSGKCEWNYWGDSKKAREYLAAGLPVIISDVPSTAIDIKDAEAGTVMENFDNEDQLVDVLDRYFSDKDYYLKIRSNAINLARQFDLEKILIKRFDFLDVIK